MYAFYKYFCGYYASYNICSVVFVVVTIRVVLNSIHYHRVYLEYLLGSRQDLSLLRMNLVVYRYLLLSGFIKQENNNILDVAVSQPPIYLRYMIYHTAVRCPVLTLGQ